MTNPEESRFVTDASYRQRWAENIADAFVAQRREGDPVYLGSAPPVTTTEVAVSGGYSRGRSHSRRGGGGRHRGRGTSSRGSSRTHRGTRGSSHGSSHGRSHSTTTTHRRRRTSN